MIRAVLFDLFETLISESATSPTRASSLGAALGLEQTAFRLEWRPWRPRIVLGEVSFCHALTEISRTLAGTVDASAVERVCDQRIREKAAAYARHDAEVVALITELGARGLRLAVLSNCFNEDVLAWPTWPLAHAFQCRVFSFAERVAKPDPEIYLRAVHRLGVQPETAVYIGDGGDNELKGAEEAGLRACQATWFLARWPQSRSWVGHGLRLASPGDVLNLVTAG